MADCPGSLHFAHMKDGPMVRIRLPGGQINAGPWRAIAALAGRAGSGIVDLTNRANLQVRGLRHISLSELEDVLDAAHLLGFERGADRLRNILADPLDGLDGDYATSSSKLVQELDMALQSSPDLLPLSPKFSFIIDNGSATSISALPHEIALIAQRNSAPLSYRLSIANQLTRLTVRANQAVPLAIAAARTALQLADGEDTRASHIIPRIGLAAFVSALDWQDIPACTLDTSSPPRRRPLKPTIGIAAYDHGGLAVCGVGIAVSRLDVAAMNALANLAEIYGDGTLRLAPWQVIFLPGIEPARIPDLFEQAALAGFACEQTFLRHEIIACSGASGCERAAMETKHHGRALGKALAGIGSRGQDMTIHLSGCPKGCAHARTADLLIMGKPGAEYDIYRDCAPGALDDTRLVERAVSPDALAGAVRRSICAG